MKTWDDVKYLFYSIAKHFVRSFPEYQIDELVNEAYIMTYPYFNDKHLYLMIWQKMMAYIRFQKVKRVGCRATQKFNNMGIVTWTRLDGIGDFEANEKNVESNLEFCELYDAVNNKTKNLNLREKIILYLKYEYNITNVKIGELFDLSAERIRQIIQNSLEKLAI